MKKILDSRRNFLKAGSLTAGALLVSPPFMRRALWAQSDAGTPDYTLHIKNSVVEIAPKRFVPITTYNGQTVWEQSDRKSTRLNSSHD